MSVEVERDICVKCLLFVNNKIVKQHTVIIGVIYEHDQIISRGKNPPHCKNVVIQNIVSYYSIFFYKSDNLYLPLTIQTEMRSNAMITKYLMVIVMRQNIGYRKAKESVRLYFYVIKFVSNLWQVGGSLRVLWFPQPINLTATILLKYC